MKLLLTTFRIAISMLVVSAHVNAMTPTEYQAAKSDKQKWPQTQVYLHGVGLGASITSALLVQQDKPTPFCQPAEIELDQDHYIKLLDTFMAKNNLPALRVETAMVMALVTAFPCAQ